MSFFIGVLNKLDRSMDYRFVAEEMRKHIPQELDFINEGHNAERIAADFAGVEDIVVPDIYWDYTTQRVLTMEYIDGVKITDCEGMRAHRRRPSDVAKILVFAFAEMIVKHGFFHADPHPGNLMVQPGPKLVLIDFGQAKELGAPSSTSSCGSRARCSTTTTRRWARPSATSASARSRTTPRATSSSATPTSAASRSRCRRPAPAGPRASLRGVLRGRHRRSCKKNQLTAMPPELLLVGRVFGLLNGLSKTLQAKTNMLVAFAQLADQLEAERTGAAPSQNGVDATRRLLEA